MRFEELEGKPYSCKYLPAYPNELAGKTIEELDYCPTTGQLIVYMTDGSEFLAYTGELDLYRISFELQYDNAK